MRISVGVLLAGGGAITLWMSVDRLRRAPTTLPATRESLAETLTRLKSEVKR